MSLPHGIALQTFDISNPLEAWQVNWMEKVSERSERALRKARTKLIKFVWLAHFALASLGAVFHGDGNKREV